MWLLSACVIVFDLSVGLLHSSSPVDPGRFLWRHEAYFGLCAAAYFPSWYCCSLVVVVAYGHVKTKVGSEPFSCYWASFSACLAGFHEWCVAFGCRRFVCPLLASACLAYVHDSKRGIEPFVLLILVPEWPFCAVE